MLPRGQLLLPPGWILGPPVSYLDKQKKVFINIGWPKDNLERDVWSRVNINYDDHIYLPPCDLLWLGLLAVARLMARRH
jgi:hypothetical protein